MSYTDILTEELQNELMMLKDQGDHCSWRIGDIANMIIDTGAPKTKAYQAIGLLAGRASRTVREYAAVSRYYPEDIRRRFSVLSYDHFRVAVKTAEPIKALEWAEQQVDELNRPATVDAMIREFTQKMIDDPAEDLHGILLRLLSIMEHSNLPEKIKAKVKELIKEIEAL